MGRMLKRLRRRYPVLDHALRMWSWGGQVQYGRLAASVTYFGFLSLFPLLALAFAVLGYLSSTFPDIQSSVQDTVSDYLPGLIGTKPNQISLDSAQSAATTATVFGLVSLLWTGTGFIDALRDAIRSVFATTREKESLPHKKVRDALVLALVGLLIVASVGVSIVASTATGVLLDAVDLGDSLLATLVLRVVSIALSLLLDALVIALLFRLLGGRDLDTHQLRGGALLGAVGIEVLKLVSGFLLSGTTHNALYATFAVIVGLLLWINFTCRVLMLSACWVATEASVGLDRARVTTMRPEDLSPLLVVPRGERFTPRRRGPFAAVVAVAVGVVLAVRAAAGGSD